jgi:hypothetical protein
MIDYAINRNDVKVLTADSKLRILFAISQNSVLTL